MVNLELRTLPSYFKSDTHPIILSFMFRSEQMFQIHEICSFITEITKHTRLTPQNTIICICAKVLMGGILHVLKSRMRPCNIKGWHTLTFCLGQIATMCLLILKLTKSKSPKRIITENNIYWNHILNSNHILTVQQCTVLILCFIPFQYYPFVYQLFSI